MSLQRMLASLFTPTTLLIAAAAVVALIALAVLLSRLRDRRRILAVARTPEPLRAENELPGEYLLRRSGLVERLAKKKEPSIVTELGIAPLWTERLLERGRPADFRRVLAYCPHEGLFACFLLGTKNRKLMSTLTEYIAAEDSDRRLELLAETSDGRLFAADAAATLVERWSEQLLALAVHPEWNARNFALRVLCGTDIAEQLLYQAIDDPHPLNRVLSITSVAVDPDRVTRLAEATLDDPDETVRSAAATALREADRFQEAIDLNSLTEAQRSHIAPLLDPASDEQTSVALDWLENGSREVQLPAARLLEESGALSRLLEESDFGDRTGLERRRRILSNALEVRVAGFLEVLEHTNRPAVLLLGAELLSSHGDPDLVRVVAERVFRMQERVVPNYVQLYAAATAAIGARGDDAALLLLLRELYARRRPELLRAVLNAVPAGRDTLFAEPLLTSLADDSFPERQALRRAILRLDSARVLSASFSALTAPDSQISAQLRVDALFLISQLDLSFALRPVLEQTGTLSAPAVAGLVEVAYAMDPKRTTELMRELVCGKDARIRAALISALPQVDPEPFSEELERALHDSDPDVRVSAIQTLDALENLATLGANPGLVRDRVTRVRSAFATALARSTIRRDIATLRETVCSADELEEVRICVVRALAGNPAPHATETLLDLLTAAKAVSRAATAALARVPTHEGVLLVAGRHAKASEDERESIEVAAKALTRKNEELLLQSIEESPEAEIPALSGLLDATGYTTDLLGRLRHREPEQRMIAANALARLEGVHAAAGVVLASWDSHPDVQNAVADALERLKSALSEEIRHELHAHPVRRVRKYSDRTFGPIAG